MKLLEDSSQRVRFFAAQSLGKLKRTDAVQPILSMLRENNDRDIYLRHAGVVALSRCAEPVQLRPLVKDGSAAVRMAALLAMRRLHMPEVAELLNDENDLLIIEALARLTMSRSTKPCRNWPRFSPATKNSKANTTRNLRPCNCAR